MSLPKHVTAADRAQSAPGDRAIWPTPRLIRMGTVAALTSKVDNKGKNDGGKAPKRRT
ncbi:MAG: hypothetical protein Q8K55_09830 [Gemmatimonadaceae bacterium]|nr:hypothetical protein [Gemmatimonadaceae bacterium]